MVSKGISRREFVKEAAAKAVGVGWGLSSLSAFAEEKASAILKRPLGKTGLEVTILGLGCVAIGYGPHSVVEGAKIVEACIDSGINYIDCASSYGDAEIKVGEVMKTRRKDVVLATKTLEREKESSWREINRSLQRLRTEYVDLLQIHSINSMDQLDQIMNGSLLSAIRAKEEGLCKHIGITGHTRPAVIKEALNRYPFDTTLVPLSSTDKLINDFGETLFPIARETGFGIVAMKVLAAGRVTEYVAESIRYVMSLPVSTAIVGMGTLEEVRQNVAVAKRFSPMSAPEMRALEQKTRSYATTSVLWWKRT